MRENKNYKLLSYQSVTKQLNNITYTNYFYRLMLIARSLFKWNNLPNGINEKWIERYLFSEGSCVFYKDPIIGFMVAKIGNTGALNYYDEPTTIRPYATNYLYENKNTDGQLMNGEDCVIIRNNADCIPTFPMIQLYSADLTNIKRTIDTNIEGQKMPIIIKCTDKQKLSLKQAIKQKQDNEPVIYGDKNLNTEDINVLKTDTPIVFDKLQVQKTNVLNECLTFLGINNANTDKRERLVTNEVDSNNEMIQINSDVMLETRKQACKEINDMFGLNISVERRNDLKIDLIESDEDIELKEGDDI
nr:MAG TPA: upper collar protein [Caudoviricetes sp.]